MPARPWGKGPCRHDPPNYLEVRPADAARGAGRRLCARWLAAPRVPPGRRPGSRLAHLPTHQAAAQAQDFLRAVAKAQPQRCQVDRDCGCEQRGRRAGTGRSSFRTPTRSRSSSARAGSQPTAGSWSFAEVTAPASGFRTRTPPRGTLSAPVTSCSGSSTASTRSASRGGTRGSGRMPQAMCRRRSRTPR